MTAAEARIAGTLALVIRWAHEREEACVSRGAARFWRLVTGKRIEIELRRRGVDVDALASAIDADGSRS